MDRYFFKLISLELATILSALVIGINLAKIVKGDCDASWTTLGIASALAIFAVGARIKMRKP